MITIKKIQNIISASPKIGQKVQKEFRERTTIMAQNMTQNLTQNLPQTKAARCVQILLKLFTNFPLL